MENCNSEFEAEILKKCRFIINQFIQQVKVNEAKKLLDLTNELIGAIAARLNF
ncbi:hypothetical protein ACIFQM_03300 [Paenibacillus sp. NRS-1782]|uniref:hypothetical protein n=1 Tax=unclassified Paenibacillus TaxID=185978 RepID=UPI003D29CE2B